MISTCTSNFTVNWVYNSSYTGANFDGSGQTNGRRLLTAARSAYQAASQGRRRMLSYESSASWSSRETFIGEDIGTVPDPTRVDQTYTELVGIYAVCDYPDVRVDPDLNTARTRMWMIEVEVTMADFTRRSVVRPLAAGYKDDVVDCMYASPSEIEAAWNSKSDVSLAPKASEPPGIGIREMFLMPYSDDFPYAYPDAHETTHNFTCNDCFPRAESGEWDGIAFAVHSTAAADAMVGESFKLTHVSFGGDEMGGVEKEADFVKLPEYHNTTSAKYIAYRCEPGATAVDDKLYMVGFKFTVESAVVRVSSADLTGNALSPARVRNQTCSELTTGNINDYVNIDTYRAANETDLALGVGQPGVGVSDVRISTRMNVRALRINPHPWDDVGSAVPTHGYQIAANDQMVPYFVEIVGSNLTKSPHKNLAKFHQIGTRRKQRLEYHTSVSFYVDGSKAGAFLNHSMTDDTGVPSEFKLRMMQPLTIGREKDPSLWIGRLGSACDDPGCIHYKGSIDELRIWEDAVTQSNLNFWADYKIKSWHNNFQDLVAYYDFTYNPASPMSVRARSANMTVLHDSWHDNTTGIIDATVDEDMTLRLTDTKWLYNGFAKDMSVDVSSDAGSMAPPSPPAPQPSPPPSPPPPTNFAAGYVCPFKCSDRVDYECPCYSQACQMQILEFGKADVACLQIITGYCLAGGQVEEKEPCAKFVERPVTIRKASPLAPLTLSPDTAPGGISMDFPAGAFTSEVDVAISAFSDFSEIKAGTGPFPDKPSSDMIVLQPHGTQLAEPVRMSIPFEMGSGGNFSMGKTASPDSTIWNVLEVNVTNACDVPGQTKCDVATECGTPRQCKWGFAAGFISSFSVVAVFPAPQPLPELGDITLPDGYTCPFTCTGTKEFDYVNKRDNICPCKLSKCADNRLDIISADFPCVQGMIDYCAVAPGWFYEPANCWPYHARNISIDVVSGIHHTYKNTPVLGDRHVAISWPDVPSPLEILVTEVAREDLENFKDKLPDDYAEAKSDYIFIRHNGTSQDDVKFTLRIPFDSRLIVNTDYKEAFKLAYLGSTTASKWEEVAETDVKFYQRGEEPKHWSLSGQDWYNQNTWTNWYDQSTWTEEEVKASYKGRYEEEGSFNTAYSESWTSWFDEMYDKDPPKHFDNTSVIWYMEANVTKFGVYCVMELGYNKPPLPHRHLRFHLHRAHRPRLLHHGQT